VAPNKLLHLTISNKKTLAKAKVFEIFRRAGTLDMPGEGMGLAYVKTLVRRLGGRIWCESELGVGTLFCFTIPNHESPSTAS